MDVPESSKQLKVTLDTFVDEFREHQEALKAHLKGNLPNELPLLPALILPASYWTSAEKDLFFHGLSVYSRLQPELIAQNIRTKTTFDVCVYLDVLAKAAELIEDDDDDENENENENEGMQSGKPLIEPAMELSEEWIQHEETIAAILMEVDACPCSLEVPNEGPSSKQNEKTCTCPVNPGQRVEEGRRSVKEAVVEKQNKYLNHLDPTCLTVLDWIIHERGYEGEPANDPVGQPQGLESKMGTQGGNETTPGPPNPSVAAKRDAELADKEQRRRLQKRLHMRRKRAEAAGKKANLVPERLRPGRLATSHKPRKRPPKTDNTQKFAEMVLHDKEPAISSDGEGNDDDRDEDGEAVEQRPGPQATPTPLNDGNDNEEGKESTEKPRTRPDRIKQIFTDGGMDSQSMLEMDLEFFHLLALAKLLDLNQLLNGRPGMPAISSISVCCVPLLKEIVKEFVSEIVRHAIVLKEQEIRLKAKLKVWKYDPEEISAENVVACLRSLGLDGLDKENYFAQLMAGATEEGSPADIPMDEESDAASVDEEPEERAPEEHGESIQNQPTQAGIPFPPSSLSHLSNFAYCDFVDEDDIMSFDLDEFALKRELEEEVKLNSEDEKTSRQYERDLWKGHAEKAS